MVMRLSTKCSSASSMRTTRNRVSLGYDQYRTSGSAHVFLETLSYSVHHDILQTYMGHYRRAFWSLAVMLGSWAATNLAFITLTASQGVNAIWWTIALLMAGVSGMAMLTGWLFTLLPLALILPKESTFWRWHTCAPIGAIVGAIFLLVAGPIFLQGTEGAHWLFGAVGAVCGGFTGLIAAITRHRIGV